MEGQHARERREEEGQSVRDGAHERHVGPAQAPKEHHRAELVQCIWHHVLCTIMFVSDSGLLELELRA